jgi:transposase-like protein
MARPSRLTPARIETIVELVRAGVPREDAAKTAGVAPSTLFDWLRRGREALQEASDGEVASELADFAELARGVEQADGECEAGLVAVVQGAAHGGDWRAAVAMLERRWPRRWGRYRERPVVEAPAPPTVIRFGFPEPTVDEDDQPDGARAARALG